MFDILYDEVAILFISGKGGKASNIDSDFLLYLKDLALETLWIFPFYGS
jgi:hypothetical protein